MCACACVFGELKLKDDDSLFGGWLIWKMICVEDDLFGGWLLWRMVCLEGGSLVRCYRDTG